MAFSALESTFLVFVPCLQFKLEKMTQSLGESDFVSAHFIGWQLSP